MNTCLMVLVVVGANPYSPPQQLAPANLQYVQAIDEEAVPPGAV